MLVIGTITFFIYYKVHENNKKDNTIVVKKDKNNKDNKTNSLEKEPVKEISEEKYKVDIKGQVKEPGIYEVKISSRVIDVIELAKGLTENADTSVINLSKKVTDEMVIIVYSKDEVKEFKKTKEVEQQVQEKCLQKDENALKNDACISTDTTKTPTKVSLNSATAEELMTLTGIGEAKAKEIIAYRDANGPFKTIEELKNIPGIGESIFAKIKENITI